MGLRKRKEEKKKNSKNKINSETSLILVLVFKRWREDRQRQRQKEGGEAATVAIVRQPEEEKEMVAPSKDILDDLCMRFVLNCPEEELKSWERLLFQVCNEVRKSGTKKM